MINTFRNYALLLVVFIHAHIYLSEYSRVEAPYWLIYIYNNFIGYFHPASVLAAISGYLFYKDLSGDPEKWNMFLKEKYFKRIKSILIPYLFWVSLFFVVNNVLIYFAASLKPGVFINSFHDLSFTNYIKAFFYPEIAIAQHLWYLNNLLFFFAIAPLMPFLMRNNVVFVAVFIAIMLLYWFSLSKDMTQSHVIIKYRFITFFLMGSFFAYKRHYLGLFISNKLKLTLVCFVILAGIFLTQYMLRFMLSIAW